MPCSTAQPVSSCSSRVGDSVSTCQAPFCHRPRCRATGRHYTVRQGEAHDRRLPTPRAPSVSGVPLATIRPRAMIATRSASVWASSMKCVVSRIVLPRPAQAAHRLPRLRGGPTGRSRSSAHRGTGARDRRRGRAARSTRRCWPPDSCSDPAVARLGQADELDAPRRRRADAGSSRRTGRHDLAHGEVRLHARSAAARSRSGSQGALAAAPDRSRARGPRRRSR